MSKSKLYSLLAVLVVLLVYGYEYFLNQQEHANIIKQGSTVKEQTNEFFLPTSTTGQVVHHEGYSLFV